MNKNKIKRKTAITKSPPLSTIEQINDTQNTDREILAFKYLKTIERSKLQTLYSSSLHTHACSHTVVKKKKKKKKKNSCALVLYNERFQFLK